MVKNRGEDPRFLGARWDRLQQIIADHDIWDDADIRAYLLTPRGKIRDAGEPRPRL